MPQHRLVVSDIFDPWYNLALEEYLLGLVSPGEVILYLWQNKHTVVIGRNQNPWKECRCKEFEESGGKLARRLSGGGAVYHDLGNLNFTFVAANDVYDVERQLSVILSAVQSFGIDAAFTGRNDLTVEGRKFSGNAFYGTETASYHHGTLLVATDFAAMGEVLQPARAKIESKGIDSIRSRVVNLQSLQAELTVDRLRERLVECFTKEYGSVHSMTIPQDNPAVDKLHKRYASWSWRYGESPEFDITLVTRFAWGGVELGLQLRNGHIQHAALYSDAMNADLIPRIANSFPGLPFDLVRLADAISGMALGSEELAMAEDLRQWLISQSRLV